MAIKTNLQALTCGLLLSLTAPDEKHAEMALQGLGKIAGELSEEEVDYAKEMASALADASKSCFFGMTEDNQCAAFYKKEELDEFLVSYDDSRLATKSEINQYIFGKASAIEYRG